MSEAYVGEIRCFGFNFAPFNWAACNGQLLPISQHAALFSILGTNFGGNGTTTFALPNLQGCVPMHWGNGLGLTPVVLGENVGSPTVSLIVSQMPSHTHVINTFQSQQTNGTKTNTPSSTVWIGDSDPDAVYSTAAVTTPLSPKAIGLAGNGLPHENRQPFLVINFCICLIGVFPSRN